MRREAGTALDIVAGRSNTDISGDPVLSHAIAHALLLIGEISAQTPEAFRQAEAGLPWSEARALRNRIVHGYRTLVPDILIDTAREDLPLLVAQIDALLERGSE